jgi:SAM-dependent methyltransferase
MTDTRKHWDSVYTTRAETAVSWYQPHSEMSLRLIRAAAPPEAGVIDIGGGASTLVDDLLEDGYADLTVLDVSSAALAKAKTRLGEKSARVNWIVADITRWMPPRTWQLWHDRAVFHFLVEKPQQDAYIGALTSATVLGGTVIMATFAPDGPEKCSGLPVQRYSPALLAERLGPAFALIDQARETHVTPGGVQQRFAYAVLRRVG